MLSINTGEVCKNANLFLMFGIGLALSVRSIWITEIIQSLNPEFNKAVIRVNVFREHRQTIQVRLVPNPATRGASVLLCINVLDVSFYSCFM